MAGHSDYVVRGTLNENSGRQQNRNQYQSDVGIEKSLSKPTFSSSLQRRQDPSPWDFLPKPQLFREESWRQYVLTIGKTVLKHA